MRKLYFFLFFCLCFSTQSFTQEYVVRLAAFDTKVSTDYFKNLSGVYHVEDHNNIHRYYIGGFNDQAKAEAKAKEARSLGYNAVAIDMDARRNLCSSTCGISYPKVDLSKVQSIFFDFDASSLRSESRRQLNQLHTILSENPQFNVELSAHTDAKGSLTYNEALSQRRANAAKKYLISKGVSESRIKVSTFGENSPIAKNELSGGKDTPEGRQYNRRVELIVYNPNGAVEPVVEEIDVPVILKSGN